MTVTETVALLVLATAAVIRGVSTKDRAGTQISQSPYAALPTRGIEQKTTIAFKKTAQRLKKLVATIKTARFKKLEDYVKGLKLAEKRLDLHRRTLAFYVQKVTKVATLERSKNFRNEPAIARYETRSFQGAEQARTEYVRAVGAYKAVFAKLERAQPTLKSEKKHKIGPKRAASRLVTASDANVTHFMREAPQTVTKSKLLE